MRFDSALSTFHGGDATKLISLIRQLGIQDIWEDSKLREIASRHEYKNGEKIGFDATSRVIFTVEACRVAGKFQDNAAFCAGIDEHAFRMSQFLYILAHYGRHVVPRELDNIGYNEIGPVEPPLLEAELVSFNLEQLSTLGHRAKALALASESIERASGDRSCLANILRPICPSSSRWWIDAVLQTHWLGPEQCSDALATAAHAARTNGDTTLAALLHRAARNIDPDAQHVALSQGWMAFEIGDVPAAEENFKRVQRFSGLHHLRSFWPQIGGHDWPSRQIDSALFALPRGHTKWPRITVVTPSYNQAQFIEQTILSVLNQNYPNLQYIVVDGGSIDGSCAILERYRHLVDILLIEPDNGQAEAINKGLRLAEGEIVAWLNSDDMYAPGALHMAGLKWLETGSDIIAGICCEHDSQHIRTCNKPKLRPEEFTVEILYQIMDRWFEGYFFYQPEAFISRSLLNQVGYLDESLDYTMDYDLWMRCAAHSARVHVVDWPFAFFRKHAAQKTSSTNNVLREQHAVRTRYYTTDGAPETYTALLKQYADKFGCLTTEEF